MAYVVGCVGGGAKDITQRCSILANLAIDKAPMICAHVSSQCQLILAVTG